MYSVRTLNRKISASSEKAVHNVKMLEEILKDTPQAEIKTQHIIHGGMYSRTIKIPPHVILIGAMIKLPTLLIMYGDVVVYANDEGAHYSGYNAFAASAHRKQAFVTLSDVYLTMVFPTTAKTVEEAEKQFTDEIELLLSHKQDYNNVTIITGE